VAAAKINFLKTEYILPALHCSRQCDKTFVILGLQYLTSLATRDA
jgi:hypothetical protein